MSKSAKINLLIVGAQKAGTTSLLNYLKSHPEIAGHMHNEFSYFTEETYDEDKFQNLLGKQFDYLNEPVIVAKNITLSLQEKALINLQEHNPDVKIVFMLRNPVARAYSAYNMHKRDGKISIPFSNIQSVIDKKDDKNLLYQQFIRPGMYARQLKTLRNYFPDRNIRLFLFEDFIKNPGEICTELFTWLGLTDKDIDNTNYNPTLKPKSKLFSSVIRNLKNKRNPVKRIIKSILPYSWYRKIADKMISWNSGGEKYPDLNMEIRKTLYSHYQKHNQELSDLIERHFTESWASISLKNWLKGDSNL